MDISVDDINSQYDEWVSVLNQKLRKLKLLVQFNDSDESDQLLELIEEINNIEIKL